MKRISFNEVNESMEGVGNPINLALAESCPNLKSLSTSFLYYEADGLNGILGGCQ